MENYSYNYNVDFFYIYIKKTLKHFKFNYFLNDKIKNFDELYNTVIMKFYEYTEEKIIIQVNLEDPDYSLRLMNLANTIIKHILLQWLNGDLLYNPLLLTISNFDVIDYSNTNEGILMFPSENDKFDFFLCKALTIEISNLFILLYPYEDNIKTFLLSIIEDLEVHVINLQQDKLCYLKYLDCKKYSFFINLNYNNNQLITSCTSCSKEIILNLIDKFIDSIFYNFYDLINFNYILDEKTDLLMILYSMKDKRLSIYDFYKNSSYTVKNLKNEFIFLSTTQFIKRLLPSITQIKKRKK